MPTLTSFIHKYPQETRWLLKDKYGVTEVQEELTAQLENDFQRLESGEPIQYIIGWVNFLGCHIDLSQKPLIPRPETEFWVEKVVSEIRDTSPAPKKALDLCCGSGCIGIALLSKMPEIHLDFVDISERALAQTQRNLQLNTISAARYELFQSDLFAQLPQQKYDVILCNPPYVDPDGENPDELKFEPTAAIFAQNHGLAVIDRFLQKLPTYLAQNGKSYLEFGMRQGANVVQLCEKAGLAVVLKNDQYGVERYAEITSKTT